MLDFYGTFLLCAFDGLMHTRVAPLCLLLSLCEHAHNVHRHAQGPGLYVRPDDKDVYLGYWHAGAARGRGYRYFADGSFYIGDMDKNVPHGEGIM